NPYGYSIYVYPFTLLRHNSMISFVQEWFSPDFHASYLNGYQLCLFLVPALLLTSRRARRPADLMLALFWAHQSLVSRRHIPIFLIVIIPLLAEHLAGAAERIAEWIHTGIAAGKAVTQSQQTTWRRLSLTTAVLLLVGVGIGREVQGLPRG